MAFSTFETARHSMTMSSYCHRKTASQFGDALSLGFLIEGQNIILFHKEPSARAGEGPVEFIVARARWVRATGEWKIFYPEADGSWQKYVLGVQLTFLEQFLLAVDQDPYGFFWGRLQVKIRG